MKPDIVCTVNYCGLCGIPAISQTTFLFSALGVLVSGLDDVCTGRLDYDSCTRHEKCRRILKHVLKPYDSRSHHENVRMKSCLRSLLDASIAR